MLVTPAIFMMTTAAITAGSFALHWISSRKKRARFRDLARAAHMHYSARDAFKLHGRVARMLTVPGSADVQIADLIYGSDGESYRYIFTAEYTVGVTLAKHRRCCVGLLRERKSGSSDWSPLQIAREDLPIFQQYESLLTEVSPTPAGQ